jgi:hypothetical protein
MVVEVEDLGLTCEEIEETKAYQLTLNILGPASGACLICPGNQERVAEDKKCPYSSKCPLLRVRKAPVGKLCPIERKEIENRFSGWCQEFGEDPLSLTESTRVAVSDLTWIDIQIQRCNHILDKGDASRLTIDNVSHINQEDWSPIAWEKVLHPITMLLTSLQSQRRIIMKDWMITPEQKWKKSKAEHTSKGMDLTSTQSKKADHFKSLSIGL